MFRNEHGEAASIFLQLRKNLFRLSYFGTRLGINLNFCVNRISFTIISYLSESRFPYQIKTTFLSVASQEKYYVD